MGGSAAHACPGLAGVMRLVRRLQIQAQRIRRAPCASLAGPACGSAGRAGNTSPSPGPPGFRGGRPRARQPIDGSIGQGWGSGVRLRAAAVSPSLRPPGEAAWGWRAPRATPLPREGLAGPGAQYPAEGLGQALLEEAPPRRPLSGTLRFLGTSPPPHPVNSS